jgi:CheY-like chemotaxis protein
LADPLQKPVGMGRDGIYSMESLNGICAFVVDQEKDRRALISGILRYCGALVTAVETPESALLVMELLKPDIVIVDFTLPDDGAIDFIRRVRALKPENGGMVAAVAVGEGQENQRLARSRGYDAYVTKPLDPWEFCRVLTRLLTT